MKTLLALATGAAFLPAFAGGALARTPPDVHLVTSIRTLSHAPDAIRYVVTVRPVGGMAHGATLVLATRRPAIWTAVVPGCLSSRDRTSVACDLGDLHESESRTVRLAGRPGASGREGVPVIAQAAADNAPAVSSSLGAIRPAALRADGRPSDESSAAPDAGQSPLGESPPVQSPAAESPAVESPAAQAVPDGSPAAESPAAQSPAVESPAAQPSESAAGPPASHVARPLGGSARRAGHARPAPAPHRTHAASAAPEASAAPKPSPATAPRLPHAPVIPHEPIVPDVPNAAGAPIVPGGAGSVSPPPIIPNNPGVPLPGASASPALPQIAGQPSRDLGVSELNTVSPAGAMQAGRTSWATLIAVAVVTEAGLLWLVAGLTVWRRKRVRKAVPRRPTRSPRLRTSRPLP